MFKYILSVVFRQKRSSWVNLIILTVVFSGLFLLSGAFVASAQPENQNLPFLKAKHGTYVIAHRGVHNGVPENSLPAYQKAIDLGCDFVEIDVRTTKDGKFVSMHNSTVDQYVPGFSGKVNEMTFAELKALDIGSRIGPEWKNTRIPAFEEILQLCQGKIGIYLDLKDAPVPELVEIIKKHRMEHDIIWYIPASRMDKIRELVSVCPECVPMPDPGPAENIGTVLAQVATCVLATDIDELTKKFVKTAHRRKVMVFVDEKEGTEAEWNRILKWKTDGIQTDHPEELISFLKRRKK